MKDIYENNEPEDFDFKYPRNVQFRLGWTSVRGVARLFNEMYPHVLHLTVLPRPWDLLIRRVALYLPAAAQAFVKARLPGSFLPPQIAIKKLQLREECHEILFDDEKRMYQRLHTLQGTVIPTFYGEAMCEGRRSLIMSVVEGTTLDKQARPRITLDDLRSHVEIAASALKSCNVAYSDVKLDNIMLVKDGVVLIDFEYAWVPEDGNLDYFSATLPLQYVHKYNEYLRALSDPNAINKDLTYDLFFKDKASIPTFKAERAWSTESFS